jgi:hypothetical protein
VRGVEHSVPIGQDKSVNKTQDVYSATGSKYILKIKIQSAIVELLIKVSSGAYFWISTAIR